MAYIGANPQISLQEYLTIDDISGDFDGAETSFALLVGGVAPVPGPKQSNQLLISLNGVIQEPDDTGSAGFRLSGGNIIFSSAPSAATPFFGVALAGADYVYAGTNFPDGSVTTPSITFANDLDSGFYRTGSGELAYTSNGTFRLKIDSSGRLGVGTSTPGNYHPSFNNVVAGSTSASAGITILSSSTASGGLVFADGTSASDRIRSSIVYNHSDENLIISTNAGQDAITIDSSQRVGIQTTGPQHPLHVVGTSLVTGDAYFGASRASQTGFVQHINIEGTDCSLQLYQTTTGSSWEIANDDTGLFRILNGGTDRFAINSSGWVGIGTTSPDEKLDIEGTGDVKAVIQTTSTGSNANSALRLKTGDYNWLLQTGDAVNGGIRFYDSTNSSERARIDSSGRLLVNLVSDSNAPADCKFVLNQSEDVRFLTAGFGLKIIRSNVPGNGASVGRMLFVARDSGSNEVIGANIQAVADGAWSSGSCPTRLIFATTANGSNNVDERMRITNGGYFKASNTGSYQGTAGTYHEFRNSANDEGLYLHSTNASFTSRVILGRATRAASSSYGFLRFDSSSGSDTEFYLGGDGNAYADGSWNGGGADYAEYFEWSDGNTTAEDRRGISVVLDGDKIREAIAGEEPIGVISGNPSVVGDAAWNKWNGKYFRDDFGTYIREDYEVEDENGNTVTQQRRKINPDYDPDVEYINREDRPEWDCVGLMGKLRIRKGQVTGARWIKMRDISDSVEEWLVR